MEAVFWHNPVEGSPFSLRATHLDGGRAPKVVLTADKKVVAGMPAGRAMSRSKAKRTFTLDDHIEATKGVECRKDQDLLDETPGAYKDIDAVMRSQEGLVDVRHTLRQVICVKG